MKLRGGFLFSVGKGGKVEEEGGKAGVSLINLHESYNPKTRHISRK